MEKSAAKLNCYDKIVFFYYYAFWKKPETKDIDDEVVEWILKNKKIGTAVTSWEVIVKAWSLNVSYRYSSWSRTSWKL